MKTKAKNLLIRTKRAVFNEYLANHPSIFDGDGFDFSELREYISGEDAKKIDHKTSAKKQKPYIKVYKSERELNIVAFTLLGGSMYFGSKMQKQELAAQIVAILGISAINYQDRFSSFIFTDKVESFVKPSKKLSYVTKAVEDILEFYPVKKSLNLKNLENEIKRHIKKRSIIFLIGDFFESIDLKKLNLKHEIFAIIIRDRFEEELAKISLINFIDASSGKSLQLNLNSDIIKKYKKQVRKQDHKLYEGLKRDKVKFIKIYTDENPIKRLKKLFFR